MASFHFVNKDANNWKTRTREEGRLIQTHVAAVSRREATVARLKHQRNAQAGARPRSPPTRFPWSPKSGERSEEPSGSRPLEYRNARGSVEQRPWRWRLGKTPTNRPSLPPSTKWSPSHNFPRVEEIDEFVFSPSNILQKGNCDPFNAAAVPLDATRNELMQIWRQRYLLSLQLDLISDRKSSAVDSWSEEIQNSIDSETQLHGIFAGALAYKASRTTAPALKSALWAQALTYKGRCLRGIQNYVATGDNVHRLLPALWQVRSFDFYSGDFIAASMHLKAMKYVVVQMGGLRSLHWTWRTLVVIGDILLSAFYLQRTLFAWQEWDPGRWEVQSSPVSDNEEMTQWAMQTFAAPGSPIHREVPSALHRSLERNRRIIRGQLLAARLTRSPEQISTLAWLLTKRRTLVARMLDEYHDIMDRPFSPQPGETMITRLHEAAMCICLTYSHEVIMCSSTPSLLASFVPLHHLRAKLRQLLDAMNRAGSLAYHESLVWMSCVGACSEELLSDPDETMDATTRWFSIRMAAIAERIGLSSFLDIREVLQQFIYDEERLDGLLSSLVAKFSLFLQHDAGLPP